MNHLRRQILVAGLAAAGTAPFLGCPRPARAASPARRLKVMFAGGHPDDPETGGGGTAAIFADAGHDVSMLYLTRGEAGIQGKSAAEAAAIRTIEAKAACAILKVRPLFAGQIDGATMIDAVHYKTFAAIVDAENPDMVFTHWPIDTHRDHRACANLVFDAWLRSKRRFALYYWEAMTGGQTQTFHPTHFVDIGTVHARKLAAYSLHLSQGLASGEPTHERMSRFRGMEYGCEQAEAFVQHQPGPAGWWPPRAVVAR